MSKREQYYIDAEADAEHAYATHELRQTDGNTWLIGKPGTSDMICWISVMGPYIALAGDYETCVFRGHPGTAEGLVRWAAGGSLDYLAEKCRMGMDDQDICYSWDMDIAREDLVYYSTDEESFGAKDREVYRAAVDWLAHSIKYTHASLYDDLSDPTDQPVMSIGRVISTRVIYARAACRRLLALIVEGS